MAPKSSKSSSKAKQAEKALAAPKVAETGPVGSGRSTEGISDGQTLSEIKQTKKKVNKPHAANFSNDEIAGLMKAYSRMRAPGSEYTHASDTQPVFWQNVAKEALADFEVDLSSRACMFSACLHPCT